MCSRLGWPLAHSPATGERNDSSMRHDEAFRPARIASPKAGDVGVRGPAADCDRLAADSLPDYQV
jgi:hypothetical protein